MSEFQSSLERQNIAGGVYGEVGRFDIEFSAAELQLDVKAKKVLKKVAHVFSSNGGAGSTTKVPKGYELVTEPQPPPTSQKERMSVKQFISQGGFYRAWYKHIETGQPMMKLEAQTVNKGSEAQSLAHELAVRKVKAEVRDLTKMLKRETVRANVAEARLKAPNKPSSNLMQLRLNLMFGNKIRGAGTIGQLRQSLL